MSDTAAAHPDTLADGVDGFVDDWSADKQTFQVHWGKAMMWIFLLSDTFVFSCFLVGYMKVRISTTVVWPLPTEVFALTVAGVSVPLLLIAIMTFILITSSGTMALAVNMGYRGNKKATALLMLATAALGASFVCRVLNTRCPVRLACTAISPVSVSRISPTKITLGA